MHVGLSMANRTLFRRLVLLAAAAVLGALAAPTLGEGVLPEPTDGHRVLRDNAPAGMPTPTEPQTFEGFPDAPAFSATARQDQLTFYPCATCHDPMPTNATPRKLFAPHPAALEHGGGRFWCLQCHAPEQRNELQLMNSGSITFDDSWQLCGQCHYQPQKDWAYGAHGKRVNNWEGERVLYNCTHCHDPHSPGIKARAPEPPPPVRYGLEPMPGAGHQPAQDE